MGKNRFLRLILFNCSQYLFLLLCRKSSCILVNELGVLLQEGTINCEFCSVLPKTVFRCVTF